MIERQSLRTMLHDVGVQPLPAHKHERGLSHEYSETLYTHLETMAQRHEISSPQQLLSLLEKRDNCEPYWYAIEPNDNIFTPHLSHKAYVLDFNTMGARFNWYTGYDMSRVEHQLEMLIYREHGALMKHRLGIPFAQGWQGRYRGPGTIHPLQLGDLYALKIGAWNEALDDNELPPPLRPVYWRAHYH